MDYKTKFVFVTIFSLTSLLDFIEATDIIENIPFLCNSLHTPKTIKKDVRKMGGSQSDITFFFCASLISDITIG